MRLPTDVEVDELYQRFHTPTNIREHMRVVAAIATELGRYHKINIPLLDSAARLHDLVRLPQQWEFLPVGIHTPAPHAEINYLLLKDNFPEVATLIRSHSLMTLLVEQPFITDEAKLLYYADKRVNHATIVSVTDRLTLGQERWQVTAQTDRTPELLDKLFTLESNLFKPIPYDPNHLKDQLTATH
ncbi:MAG: HD domain-containing protein [Patescibacteria group bacterium]